MRVVSCQAAIEVQARHRSVALRDRHQTLQYVQGAYMPYQPRMEEVVTEMTHLSETDPEIR
eukprot:3958676-Amphidinium_carterae.1